MNSIQELYDKIAKDPALQAEFTNILEQGEEEVQEILMDRILSFGKALGYEGTAKEVKEFFAQLANTGEGELSDAQLDQVAGGKSAKGIYAVATSVITAGLACLMESIDRESKSNRFDPPPGCSEMFD